ncbi:MAG: hypothetical protein IT305_27290 [Chloroflexi bacterium]|nr:hypothetical protein [Chloroflexota bacterium]
MADTPRVLLTGVPGSGRHVVLSVLLTLGAPSRVDIGAPSSWGEDEAAPASQVETVRDALAAARPGGICHGAIPFDPALLDVAHEHGAVIIMVVRDPAEIPLALARQIRIHGKPSDLRAAFGALPARALELALLGGQAPALPLDRVYAAFDGWRTAPGVLVVRFEDLIGPHGGGDEDARRRAVAALAQHVGRSIDDETLERAAAATFNPMARTFVQGQAWTARRTARSEYRSAFGARYQDLPARWGYPPLAPDDEPAAEQTAPLGIEAEHAWTVLRAAMRDLRDRFGEEFQQQQARQREQQAVVDQLLSLLDAVRSESAARQEALGEVQRQLADERDESSARLASLEYVRDVLAKERAESTARLATLGLVQRYLADGRSANAARLAALEIVQGYLDEEQREQAAHPATVDRQSARGEQGKGRARQTARARVARHAGAGQGGAEKDPPVGSATKRRDRVAEWRGDEVLALGQRLLDDASASDEAATGGHEPGEHGLGEPDAASEETQGTTVPGPRGPDAARATGDRRLEILRLTYAARLGTLQLECDAWRTASRNLEARLRSVESESDVRLSRARFLEAQLAAAWVSADERLTVIRDLQSRMRRADPTNTADVPAPGQVVEGAPDEASRPSVERVQERPSGKRRGQGAARKTGAALGQSAGQDSAPTAGRASGQGEV